jgi:predicted transcriptional regulator
MTGKRSIVIDVAPDPDLARISREALAAVRRAEAGEPPARSHLAFSSWEQMRSTLTPARMALVSHLRRHPAPSVAALARAVGRDYRRVHEDVETLAAVGLVERDATGVRTEYDQILTAVPV